MVNDLQLAFLHILRSMKYMYARQLYYCTDVHSIVRLVIVNTMVSYVDTEDLNIHDSVTIALTACESTK